MLKIHDSLKNFVRPADHSTFSPSSTDRWMACPFSIKATKGIPSETSVYAEEGTLAHSVCESLFEQEYYLIPFPVTLQMQMVAWDGRVPGTSAEMMDCAHHYVNVVSYWMNNSNEIGEVIWSGLEKGIPIFPEEGCFGTADCIIVGTKGSAIIDYKHGKGKSVNADTPQLRSYAAGVARHLIDVPEDYKYFSIVVQPRTDIAPKVASYSHEETMNHLNLIHEAIMMSKKAELYPVQGNHCFWCPASRTKDRNLKCPAMKNQALKMVQEDFNGFLVDMNAPIDTLDGENIKRDAALIKVMSLLPLMQQIAKDGEAEFTYRIEKGETVEGVQIVSKEGNRQWIFDTDDLMSGHLRTKFPDVEPFKIIPEKKVLKTITDVEKEIGKNKCDEITVRKVSKKLKILDHKVQEVLGELANYGNLHVSRDEE